jgi:membrane-associated phospholipid phosphatase
MREHHTRRHPLTTLIFTAGLGIAGVTVAGAQSAPPTQLEPGAGQWKTWVLASGNEFRLPPPDETATRLETEKLRALAATRTPEDEERIRWWAAVSPAYRWNQVAVDEAVRAGLNANLASRSLALLHTALADAMIATWDSKYAFNRARPGTVDATLRTLGPLPSSPSYPDEHAVAGTVAASVLALLFPQRAEVFAAMADEEARLRLASGAAYPSDVAAGQQLGRQVANAALERYKRDQSDAPWNGSVPAGPGLWNGTNPVMPQAATWKPWVLTSPNEFRPPAPYAYDTPERAAQLTLVRDFKRTPKSNADANFWEFAVGGSRNFQYWNGHLGRLLLENGLATNPVRTARAYALFQAGFYDVGVACWDAKYAYWAIRPSQLDPKLVTVFAVPNHPSYPAAHACYSMASALMLGDMFPADAAPLVALGEQSGNSRVWAGIHYPEDVAAGQELARKVVNRVKERAASDGAGDLR